MGSCLSAESRSPLPGSPSAGLGIRKRRNSKRRYGSRSSSFDLKKDEHLLKIPGRLFSNGASEIASLFTQQGKKGTNQDAMLVWENFFSRSNTIFCGVFDGHGPYGHMVAKRVRDSLPQKLNAQWEVHEKSDEVIRQMSINSSSLNSGDTSFRSGEEESRLAMEVEEKHPDIFNVLKESFLKAYKIMDRELRLHPSVDCFCSGTTAVALIKQGQDLVIGYVGDSRAVLGTRNNKDNVLAAVQLTVDLKPNLPAEAERIKKCRGRVFALQDEPDIARVWLPNSDSPGLAMARAFGDFCLKDYGLIAVPEVTYRCLSEKDEFIVLATDGIWDVLSNKEVVDVVAASPSRSTAARLLVETAVRSWKMKYPTSKIDDCAVVCLFLDSDSNILSSACNGKGQEQTTPAVQGHPRCEKDAADSPTGHDRLGTIKTVKSILQETGKDDVDTDDDAKEDDMLLGDYSALEGVTRVNTLLTLPRFTSGKKS